MELNYLLCGCLIVIIIIILVILLFLKYRGKEIIKPMKPKEKPTKLKEKQRSIYKHKKQIAIVSTIPWHIECVGFILEYLKDYDIHVYLDGDMVNYIDYFKTKYSLSNFRIDFFNEDSYEIIIKLTSNDPYRINKKHLSILHVPNEEFFDKKDNSSFITLTPLVRSNYKYTYILSMYKDYIDQINYNKNIAFVGKFSSYFVENKYDIFDFINNVNGKLFCFGYVNEQFKNQNIVNFDNIDTITMMDKLKQCSYILIKEHNDRYSGGITIALSLNIPLIMKSSLADIYKIPAITYKNNIQELTHYINKLSFEQYKQMKYNLRSFTDKQIEINKQRLINILPKNDGSR